jgi:hypothetical protein
VEDGAPSWSTPLQRGFNGSGEANKLSAINNSGYANRIRLGGFNFNIPSGSQLLGMTTTPLFFRQPQLTNADALVSLRLTNLGNFGPTGNWLSPWFTSIAFGANNYWANHGITVDANILNADTLELSLSQPSGLEAGEYWEFYSLETFAVTVYYVPPPTPPSKQQFFWNEI